MKAAIFFVLILCCYLVSGLETDNPTYYDWYRNVWYKYYIEWSLKTVAAIYLHQVMESRKRRLVATCILEACSTRKYKRKRYWVSPTLQYRNERGFFHTVFPILHLEDLRFKNYLRMSPTQLEELVQLIGGDIYKMTYLREAIPVRERLVLTLRFLASGDSMSSLSTHYLIGNTSVCNIIHDVNLAIWKNLRPIVLKKLTKQDWKKIANKYHLKTHFVHCLGSIDGKHVNIQCPPNAGSSYWNYKGFHSIILLAICNSDYVFTYCDIGSYGRRSDGGVYSESSFAKFLNDGTLDIPDPELVIEGGPLFPYCFVADEAFPLLPNLMRPYPGKVNCSLEKRVFNWRMGRPRRFVENSFGILVNRWRIFRKPILMDPFYVIKLVKATICLHNWLRMTDQDYIPQGLVDQEGPHGQIIPGTWREENRHTVTAFENLMHTNDNPNRLAIQTREMFCELYNGPYALPWQYKYV